MGASRIICQISRPALLHLADALATWKLNNTEVVKVAVVDNTRFPRDKASQAAGVNPDTKAFVPLGSDAFNPRPRQAPRPMQRSNDMDRLTQLKERLAASLNPSGKPIAGYALRVTMLRAEIARLETDATARGAATKDPAKSSRPFGHSC